MNDLLSYTCILVHSAHLKAFLHLLYCSIDRKFQEMQLHLDVQIYMFALMAYIRSACNESYASVHHISNDGFGDFYKIDPQASATCEVLCQIFEEDKISKECAQCLYTGIVHDTGVFKHSNTTRKTMEYAGMLLEKGVSTTKIIDETFYQKTFVQNQLLGKALLKSQLYADGQIIISNLSEQDFEELHASTSDSDGIIDQLRITKGVEAAIFLYPIENGYKVSMRSNEKVKVSEIAKTHGGGGHIRAAGCSMKGTLKDIQSMIISEITEQL